MCSTFVPWRVPMVHQFRYILGRKSHQAALSRMWPQLAHDHLIFIAAADTQIPSNVASPLVPSITQVSSSNCAFESASKHCTQMVAPFFASQRCYSSEETHRSLSTWLYILPVLLRCCLLLTNALVDDIYSGRFTLSLHVRFHYVRPGRCQVVYLGQFS